MITDQHREHAAEARQETKAIATEVACLSIATGDDLVFASETLREIKGQRERLQEQLEEIIAPSRRAAKETEKAARELFRDALGDLLAAEQLLRQQISVYHSELERKRRKALAKASKSKTAVAPAAVAPKVKGVNMRTYWRWRLVDENRVPREYLMINEAKIGAVVRADKGKTEIPGIEAYSETGVVVSGK